MVEDQTEFIARFTLDGTLTFVNAAYGRYLGIAPRELIGRNLLSFVREEERLPFLEQFKSLTPANPTMTYARHANRPDGSKRYQAWAGRALFSERGETIECQIVGRDVTESKEAERALRKSEERFQRYFELGLIGMAITSPAKGVIEVNDEICRILGYERDELLRASWVEMTHPDDLAADVAQFNRVMAGEIDGYTLDKRWIRKDGRVIDSTVSVKCVRRADGSVDYFVALLEDVTERKRSEAALKQSEQFLNNIIENIPDMIFVKDAQELKFVLFNKAGKELLGLSSEQLMGRSDFDIVPTSIAELYVAKDREVLKQKQFFDIPEEPIRSHDKGARVLHTKKIPILNEAGEPQYLLGISEDITERKRAEEQIRQHLATLTTLYAGAQKLAIGLDLGKLAEDVTRTCVESFGALFAWVVRAEPDGSVRLLAQFPPDHAYPREVTARWDDTREGHGAIGEAIQSGSPVIIGGIARDPRFLPWRATALGHGFRATAAFPLVSRHRTFGALALYSDQPDYFTPERVQFFQSYALQAAAALENARLFEQTERRLSNVQALHQIDVAITSSINPRVTLDVILEQATVQLQVDAAAVLLLDPHTHLLNYAAGRGFHTAHIQRANLRIGESYAGYAALERRTIVSDVRQWTGSGLSNPTYLAFVDAEGFATHVVTPLLAQGQVKGVLEVYHRTPLEGWARALELRDGETEGHCRRVMDDSMRLVRVVGIDGSELVHVHRGALLHDVGKMGVPDSILRKPDPLSADEQQIMRQHPTLARDMLWPIHYLRPAIDIPYCHHEKWDGTGYPRGLKGEEIPLAARLRGSGCMGRAAERPALPQSLARGAGARTPPWAGRHALRPADRTGVSEA